MKILFANKYYFRKGGAETVMFDEMELMRQLNVKVIEFSMKDPSNITSPYSSYFVSPKTYKSCSISKNIRSALSLIHSREAVRNIGNLIAAEKPDIIHCNNIYHQLTPSIIRKASTFKIPIVLTLHDLKIVCPVYLQLRHGEPCSECAGGKFENVMKYRCADGSLAQSALLWAEARYHTAKRSYDRVDKFIAPSQSGSASG